MFPAEIRVLFIVAQRGWSFAYVNTTVTVSLRDAFMTLLQTGTITENTYQSGSPDTFHLSILGHADHSTE